MLWVRDDEGFDLWLLLIRIVCKNTHNQTPVQRLSDADYWKNLAIQLFNSSATIFWSCQVEIFIPSDANCSYHKVGKENLDYR